MIHQFTAVSLSCDKCHRQFFFINQNIFVSQKDARARASVAGWTQNGNKDYCPYCKPKR